MKQVDSMPTEGQFVVVFEYNGNIWSGVYYVEQGCLYKFFNDDTQSFDSCTPYFMSDKHTNQKYFVFGE